MMKPKYHQTFLKPSKKNDFLKYGVLLQVSMLNDPLTKKHQRDQTQF